ncbi:MAG: hypothetical protein HYY06_16600 [Deltaproteobacteria bacterium]|nr:hypothetical protein [Deltaproteobacteria bacterium]
MSGDEDLDAAQRLAIQRHLEMGETLAALPDVQRQQSRFEGETTLVAPGASRDAVSAVVEPLFGPPAKPADSAVPAELQGHPLLQAIGGIRTNQTLYLKQLGPGLSLYVAFWPWNGGARFTIKIGVHGSPEAGDDGEVGSNLG